MRDRGNEYKKMFIETERENKNLRHSFSQPSQKIPVSKANALNGEMSQSRSNTQSHVILCNPQDHRNSQSNYRPQGKSLQSQRVQASCYPQLPLAKFRRVPPKTYEELYKSWVTLIPRLQLCEMLIPA